MKNLLNLASARFFAALALSLPLSAMAVITTGYEDFGDTAGVVLWRATEATFHNSTVIDVAQDGTLGTAYAMDAGNGATSWKRFCSKQTTIYSSPGKVLVYDEAGYTASSDAQFTPLSLGGMWVKALQADGVPYCIMDNNSDGTAREVELGASGATTYFKFDKSFTFNRNSATKVKGEATIEIASGATFTINARANKGASVESDATLVLKGEGTLAVVSGLTVYGTLDLSAETRPTINGDVTIDDGTLLILPEGTAVNETVRVPVCSGTLSNSKGDVANVKIGETEYEMARIETSGGNITKIVTTVMYTTTVDGDTVFSDLKWTVDGESSDIANIANALLVFNGSGKVTGLAETPAGVSVEEGVTLDCTAVNIDEMLKNSDAAGIYLFTANYPTVVPAGLTYTFVGGTESEPVVLDARDVRGTLKTQGYFTFTNYKSADGSLLDVSSGSLALSPGRNWLKGTLTVEAGATFVNNSTDAPNYNGTFIANVYGTLNMGATRWSLGSSNTINLYDGSIVMGSGQISSGTNNGTLDWIENAAGVLNVYGAVTVNAPVKIRDTATVTITVDSGANEGLTLAGATIAGGKIVKNGAGLLSFAVNPTFSGITVNNGALTFGTESDVTATVTYPALPTASTSLWYAQQSNWKGTVVINEQTENAAPIPLATYGNANSTIVLKGLSGSDNYFATASGNVTIPATLQIDGNVTFNNGWGGNTYTLNKVTGGGDGITLKLASATGMTGLTYVINELDFGGTIAVEGNSTKSNPVLKLAFGNIVKAGAKVGDKVLSLTKNIVPANSTETINVDLSGATLNGVAANNLFYGTFNAESGIYLVAAKGGDDYYLSVQDALDAALAAGRSPRNVEILDASAEIPKGYKVVDGRLVKKEFFITLR